MRTAWNDSGVSSPRLKPGAHDAGDGWWAWVAAVLAWLQSGWKTPERALRWAELYPLVVLAAFIVLVVKLTPILQTTGQNLIQTVGQSLQNIFNFTI